MPGAHEANVQESTGLAQRKGRAYRDLFQLVRQQLGGTGREAAEDGDGAGEEADDE